MNANSKGESEVSENLMIAKVIAAQLGGSRFAVMTGANRMLAVERGLQFKLPSNFAKDGINCVEVKVNGSDLYDLSFKRIRGLNVTLVAEADNIYADELRSVFAEATGLALSL